MFWTQSRKNIWVVGHRGAAALYPENTMLGFEKALELGVDGIETDVHMTADGELVLIHDSLLDRTTNGTGPAEERTCEELGRLDAGIRRGEEFRGQKIPLLRELLGLLEGSSLMLNVEMKDYRPQALEKTVETLYQSGWRDRFVITCFSAPVTVLAQRKYGVKTQSFLPERQRNGLHPDPYSIGMSMEELTPERCRSLARQRVDPWCWCPDTPEQVEKAIACGATLCTCNDPAVALGVLRKKGLHA